MGPRPVAWLRALWVVAVVAVVLIPATVVRTAPPASASERPPAPSEPVRGASAGIAPAFAWGVQTLFPPGPTPRILFDPAADAFVIDQIPVPFSYLHGVVREISDTSYQQVARYFFDGNSSPRMALDSSNGTVLLTNVTGAVLFLDHRTLSVLGSVPVRARVTGILYDRPTDQIVVESSCDPGSGILEGQVTVLNASSGAELAALPIPCNPAGMVADTANGNVFVLAGPNGNLTVISGSNQSVLAEVPNVAPGAHGSLSMSFDPLDGLVYVRCVNLTSEGCIDLVNGTTGRIVRTMLEPFQVQDNFAVERDGTVDLLGWTNTSDSSSESLYAIDPGTGAVAEVAGAPCFEDVLAFNNVSGDLFAAAHCGDRGQYGGAAIYSTHPYRLLDEVTSVNNSYQEYSNSGDTSTYSPRTGDMMTSFFVTDEGSADFLLGPYPVTFRPTVWAPGVEWTVSVTFSTGWVVSVSAEVPSTTIWVPNGSYSFAWSVPTGFYASRDGGSFEMAGVAVQEQNTISWTWWAWTLFVAGIVGVFLGVRKGRGYRFDYHSRRAEFRAKLTYDLAHPLSGPPPPDLPRRPPSR